MPVPLRTTIQKAEAKYNVTTEFTNYNLHAGAANGDIGLVDYALAQGQPVNSVLDGVLPLHAAAAGGNEQVVLRLIERGADVNAPRLPRRYSNDKGRDGPIVGDSGATPLHFAAANGNTEVVRILLQRGAHPDRADKHGVTPEILARREGWVECADFLRDWARNKDKDLIEREGRIPTYRPSLDDSAASRADVQEGPSSGRKRLHVKKSIDTAFHMLKGSASDAHLRLHSLRSSSSRTNIANAASFHTPPASPTRSFGDYTFYPVSPTEDGLDPADPSKRRPSLPHIFGPPTSAHRKSSVSSQTTSGSQIPPLVASFRSQQHRQPTASPSPRRPGSAGSDADRSENPGSAPVPRRLGSKYSLINIFKKGQCQSDDQATASRPSLNSTNHVSSSSTYSSTSNLSPSPSSRLQLLPIASNDSASNSNRTPSSFRHGTPPSNSLSLSARKRTISTSKSQSPPLDQPVRYGTPSAVELHNSMAQQQYAIQQPLSASPRQYSQLDHVKGRSSVATGESPPPPLPLDDLLQFRMEDSSLTRLSSSPTGGSSPRLGAIRPGIMASRDRSGSGSSRAGSRYRGGTVFDDDLVVVDPQPPVSPSRPSSILRGSHHRTSSGNGSSGNARALRFNPALAGHHPEEGVELPAPVGLNLRGSASMGSFNRNISAPEAKEPDSAPAATTDFTDIPGDNEDVEDDYGQPILKPSTQKPVLDIQAIERTAIPNRLRGFSINSSESSFSPIDGDSGDQEQIRQGDPTTASNFPFSLNQPPPSDGTVGISVTQHEPEARLRVPSTGNDEGNRSRGDSVSSASTGTSSQGALTAMATSTPDGLRPIIEPVVYVDDIDSLETTVKIPVNLSSFKEPDGIGHRRTRTPMDINITSISTHAQAEALVQRAQQDILEMGNEDVDSEGLSTGSTGRTPLSAKLAKYGESLALERKLREQMERGEQDAVSSEASPDATQTSPPLSATHTLPESTPVSLGIQRQYSLEHRHRESRPSARQPQPRRPHTSSGTPEGRRSFTTERGKTHQSSQSASVIDVKPSLVADVRARALSIDAELESPTTPLIETSRSHSSGYPSTSNTSFLPEVIKVNSPPFTSPSVFPDEDLSRTSSLEANDTDCDGISGHSSYASLSSRAQPREVARATKLTKMGFDATASKQPTPPKRFGFRSIFQNLKGK